MKTFPPGGVRQITLSARGGAGGVGGSVLVFGPAGGGAGMIRALPINYSFSKEVAQGNHVCKGHGYSRPDGFFVLNGAVRHQRAGLGAKLREYESCQISADVKIESSVAQRFRDMIRIYYWRCIRLLGH